MDEDKLNEILQMAMLSTAKDSFEDIIDHCRKELQPPIKALFQSLAKDESSASTVSTAIALALAEGLGALLYSLDHPTLRMCTFGRCIDNVVFYMNAEEAE